MTPAAAAVIVAALVGPAAPSTLARPGGSPQADAAAIADAVTLGLSRDEARRAAFHERYLVPLGGPVVQSIEVVTEFRRAVWLAEERARQGETAWATERAAAALAPYRGRLDLVLRVRFDPLNAYRSVPDATLVIYRREGDGSPLQPASLRATPENFAGPVPPGTPILAATVEAAFPVSDLDLSRPFLVGIVLDGRELQRVPLDLTALR
jgi:hypothetical protein